MQPPDAFIRPFEELLQGSIALARLAHDEPLVPGWTNTFARHSVMDSLLLLEAVANTCLESLEIESSVLEDLDRLPVIAKFDIYLRTAFANRKLNKGLHVVAALRDLKVLRDSFAHAKKVKVIWESWSEDESTSTCEVTSVLGVPRSPCFWHEETSLIVMRAVHGFLAYYFRQLCRFKPTHVSSLLFSEDRRPNRKEGKIPYWDKETLDLVRGWRVDLSYIRLGSFSPRLRASKLPKATSSNDDPAAE